MDKNALLFLSFFHVCFLFSPRSIPSLSRIVPFPFSFLSRRTPEPTPPIVAWPSLLALRRLPFVGRCPVHFVAPLRTIQSTSSVFSYLSEFHV
ncbi:hypothetical protein IC575_028420 [Cucumis melo]